MGIEGCRGDQKVEDGLDPKMSFRVGRVSRKQFENKKNIHFQGMGLSCPSPLLSNSLLVVELCALHSTVVVVVAVQELTWIWVTGNMRVTGTKCDYLDLYP